MRRRAPTDAELSVAIGVPLLQPFDKARLAALLGPAALAVYDDDAPMFSAGDPADRFFVVIEGSVRLYATLPDGRETTIAVIEAPASFGEAAMFASGVFPVNAAAMAGSLVLRIGAGEFLAELDAFPEFTMTVLRSLRGWEMRLLEDLRNARLKSPIQRLAGYVLALCGDHAGAATVRLPLRKGMLASTLGMKPETLSRNLQRLAAAGVTSTGEMIQVADTAALLRVFRGDAPGG
jgi:CRP-like cAMP-binding protein